MLLLSGAAMNDESAPTPDAHSPRVSVPMVLPIAWVIDRPVPSGSRAALDRVPACGKNGSKT